MPENILIQKAYYLLKNKKYNEALELCDKIIEQGHISLVTFLMRGRLLVIKNKLEEAKEQYKQLLQYYPEEFNGWLELGNIRRKLKETELSIECYEKAINSRPDDERGYLAIVKVLEENKDFTKSARYLHRAFLKVRNKPDSIIKLSHNIGQNRLEIGEYDRALEILRYSLEVAKESTPTATNENSEILIDYINALMKLELKNTNLF